MKELASRRHHALWELEPTSRRVHAVFALALPRNDSGPAMCDPRGRDGLASRALPARVGRRVLL